MMTAILSAVAFFELFAFALGIIHAFDRDDETVAAPMTPWWILFAAAVPFITFTLLTWGIFIGGAVENIMYGVKPVFGLPFDFLSLTVIIALLTAWAVYHAGYIVGTVIAARCQLFTVVSLPITVPLPTIVITKPVSVRKPKPLRVKTVEEMLGIAVKEVVSINGG
ncbi:MAG: hypothetical protein QXT64_02200 [Desulfurococcaceae archaeon]